MAASDATAVLSLRVQDGGTAWNVIVANANGARSQALVTVADGRVAAGPFPQEPPTGTTAAQTAALVAATKTDFDDAATAAVGVVPGSISAITLATNASGRPAYTVTVSPSGGASRTVTVDGVTGAATPA